MVVLDALGTSDWLTAVLAALNVLQTIALAYLAASKATVRHAQRTNGHT